MKSINNIQFVRENIDIILGAANTTHIPTAFRKVRADKQFIADIEEEFGPISFVEKMAVNIHTGFNLLKNLELGYIDGNGMTEKFLNLKN